MTAPAEQQRDTEMVKRVAAAIATKIDCSGLLPMAAAEAAVRAMRDPTEAMAKAGDREMADADCLAPWRAMIDAALSESVP